MVDTIPYQCMDGMNEKGLVVSILMVDIKEGDEPTRMVARTNTASSCGNIDNRALNCQKMGLNCILRQGRRALNSTS